ncbi:MAG: N-6 DNA methylase [Clostridiales bacterium]|jgi:predicted helicase|nr:N-6 DNA methylase [Clostridiales bacterium]
MDKQTIVKEYVQNVNEIFKHGNTTEHSYRDAIKNLFNSFAPSFYAQNEPKRVECGAPDFVITKSNVVIGHIEAKDIPVDLHNLKGHDKEQQERFIPALNNLIYTNCLEFIFFRNAEQVGTATIAEINCKGIKIINENVQHFIDLLDGFYSAKVITVTSADKLARIMASKSRLLTDAMERSLYSGSQSLKNQLQVFDRMLIRDIREKDFCDIYSQTIAYGLLVARMHDNSPETFSKREAETLIPKSNPFLRNLFRFVASEDNDDSITWIIDDLAEMFRFTDVKKIFAEYGKTTGLNDPILHFYETFLKEFDPKKRKENGVYYTPKSVVDFIVRSVDYVLKNEFEIVDGLADYSTITKQINGQIGVERDKRKTNYGQELLVEKTFHKVEVLDPACGTGTFPTAVIELIADRFKNRKAMWNSYVAEHLIPRLHGFEIMMASYSMAHLKLGFALESTGCTLPDKRLGIYLTDALEPANDEILPLFLQFFSNEAREANEIKSNNPIMCVIGNPPYNVNSTNKGAPILKLLEAYKREPTGGKLKERNPKCINDDYVKFIRLAESYIEKNNYGIIGFITNNGFLENPTFRGMRWHLLNTFDKVYTINLHGNSLKKEKSPSGDKDENVFNIQQGTAITIFIKNGKRKASLAEVFYKDIYGLRKDKFAFLDENTVDKIDFAKVNLTEPNYFFIPKDNTNKAEYEKGISLTEAFILKNSGVQTDNDNELISFQKFNTPSCKTIAYRLFDKRFIDYDLGKIGRARYDTMKHLLNNGNIALVFKRGFPNNTAPVFITNTIADRRYWTCPGMQGAESVAPLYLYAEAMGAVEKIPNLNAEIVKQITDIIDFTPTPEQVFDYIYGYLHSPAYRAKFAEQLKIDFPRVPYPKDDKEFNRYVDFGTKLRKLHLMETVPAITTKYEVGGNNIVDKYNKIDNKIYINDTQYFDDVPVGVWEFFVGGYQPLQSWLKYRKGRTLTFNDLSHYQKIIEVLAETIKIMREIK